MFGLRLNGLAMDKKLLKFVFLRIGTRKTEFCLSVGFNQFSDRDELIDFLLKNTIFSDCDLDLSGTGGNGTPRRSERWWFSRLARYGCNGTPEGLSVGGYLDLRGTGVTELPKV